jgi:alkylresorcinol/alkylpyrone synthase
MTIAGVASAFPPHQYDQSVVLSALQRHWGPKVQNPVFMERLQARVGVDKRCLALPLERYETLTNWGEANNHWIEVAQDLGEKSLCRALTRAGVAPPELDALFFTSITGIACPSIDARLVNRMGLSRHLKRIPIFGLGCQAGACGLARAADYVLAYPRQVAAVLSVELCSLTLQHSDLSVANLISSGLFGDGSAAAIVTGAEREGVGPEILDTRSVLYPNTEHILGWDISEKGFRIVLDRELPDLVQQNLAPDVDAFLEASGLARADIGTWILHTGGPRVLEATAAALDLSEEKIGPSWDCLRKNGNISSAAVLVILEELMTRNRPEAGTHTLMIAMGPGFSAELVLLRW